MIRWQTIAPLVPKATDRLRKLTPLCFLYFMPKRLIKYCPRRNSLFRGSFLRSAVKTTTSYNPEEPINRLSRSKTVASAQVVPDMEGWLHKRGDKYKTWNRRWFVLKGSNLFYFKNPKVGIDYNLIRASTKCLKN